MVMDCERLPSATFSMIITNYSTTVKRGCITWLDSFSAGWSRWKIGIQEEEVNHKHGLYLYLSVADDEDELLPGWYREAYFRLTLRQLIPPYMFPRGLEKRMEFTNGRRKHGWLFATLSQLRDGYLVDDTLEVRVSIIVLRAFPRVRDDKCGVEDKFKQYVSPLAWYLEVVAPGSTKVKPAARDPNEVKKAQQSLKECLLRPYEPNATNKLEVALTTLDLTVGQSVRIQLGLKKYIEDYWSLQRANSDCQISMLHKAWNISGLIRCYDTNIRLEGELDYLILEGERLKERIKQGSRKDEEDKKELILEFERVKDMKFKILLDLEISAFYTERWWSNYDSSVEEVAQAEKEKGAAEKRLSISTIAWSSTMNSLLDLFP